MNPFISIENSPVQEQAVQKLISMLRAKMKRENVFPEPMKRDAHPKMIGLVRAEFTVNKNLAEHLKIGLFSVEKTYPTWVRFSNQMAPPTGDNVRDIRGMALKLLEVEGEKVLEGEEDFKTHDFITASTDVFVTKDVVQFASMITALISGKLKLVYYFIRNPKNLWNLLMSSRRFGSLLEAQFYSITPYAFGDRVVKYSLKPRSSGQTPVASKASQNYLSSVMENQLSKDEYYFDFMIQFQTDLKKMPLEDLSVRWKESDSPFIKVATLKIHRQKFTSEEQKAFGDSLSFSPWHCLPEHTPIGSVNRARKIVYHTLSRFRHEENKLPVLEPTSLKFTQPLYHV